MKKPKLNLDAIKDSISSSKESSISQSIIKLDSDTSNKSGVWEPRTFKKIPIKKLVRSSLNDYPIVPEEVKEMEDLLLQYGLLESLNVYYMEEADQYAIESGEKRFTALNNLIEKYESNATENELYYKNIHPLYVNGIPCMVEKGEIDPDTIRERIIIHNETNRPVDPIRTAAKLNELSEIYRRRNKTLPKSERFNVNQEIANKLNGKYSVRTIIRYKNFGELIPELQEAITNNNLPISDSAQYHQLSEEEQMILAESINNNSSQKEFSLPSVKELREIYENILETENSENTQSGIQKEGSADFILSDLKKEAVKSIISNQNAKSIKIKNTSEIILKKAKQLEKLYGSIIDNSDLSDITDLNDTINNIISILKNLLEREK